MKLVYFWVDKIHDFEVNKGINMGSEWIYWLDKNQENSGEEILRRRKNEDYISGFWGNRISNVTALVGENGSGKTTVLNDLGFFLDGKNGVGGKLIFEDQDGDKSIIYSSYQNLKSDGDFDLKALPRTFKPTAIYFSPVYNFSRWKSFGIDVSSDELLATDLNDGTESSIAKFDPILFHRSMEILRQIEVLKRLPNLLRNSGIPTPNVLKIKLFEIADSSIPNKDQGSIFDNFKIGFNTWAKEFFAPEDTNPFRKEIYLINEQSDKAEKLGDGNAKLKNFQSWKAYLNSILKIFLFAARNAQLKVGNDMLSTSEAPDIQPGISKSREFLKTTLLDEDFGTKSPQTTSRAEEFLFIFLQGQEVFSKELITFFQSLKKLLFHDDVHIQESTNGIGSYGEINVVLEQKEVRDFIFDFYFPLLQQPTYVKGLSFGGHFLEFYWEGFSHGEQARFNLLSRLNGAYTLILKQATGQRSDYKEPIQREYPKNLFLIMDEPEYGWHIKWQRELVQDINNLLPEIFTFPNEMKPEIQIIFATHSPVSLSDIPAAHVVLLEKLFENEIKKINIQAGNQLKTNTFGSNIHDLLKDSFFMGDGFMGKFAEEKIKKIIDRLQPNEPEIDDSTKENLEREIKLIGEPILKQKLLEMLDFKRNGTLSEISLIDRQMEDLQKRKDKIQNKPEKE